jgi:gluconokinase
MQAGIPLTDADRAPWLQALRQEIARSLAGTGNLALACSALKRTYREQLMVGPNVKLVYLRGSFEILQHRLERRKGHFMSEQLLSSQLETLEEPADAVTIDVDQSVDEIVAEIVAKVVAKSSGRLDLR